LSYLSGNNIDTTDHFRASLVLHTSVWIYSYHKSQTQYSVLSLLQQHNIHCLYLTNQGRNRQLFG